jgi:opacity protein-like surface antigen
MIRSTRSTISDLQDCKPHAGWKVSTAAALFSGVLFATVATSLHAQSQTSVQTSVQPRSMDLRASLMAPLNLAVPSTTPEASSSSAVSSSVSPDSVEASVEAERLTLSNTDASQPPPRRSYGRPRYNDNSHNADGSNKYTFEFGVGLTVPVGGTHNYSTPGYAFQAGVGRNFNKDFGLVAQFDYDHFGIQTSTLNAILPIYQALCQFSCTSTGSPIQQIGGSTHIWSFSLNPIYTLAQSDRFGAYAVVGIGFYHKVTNITTPDVGTYCSYYGFCYQFPANSTIDKYTSNAPGYNGGLGLTYRPSRFSNEKFFVEVRYVFIDNQPRPYFDGTTGTSRSPTYLNLFPQNSARTTYIPIKVGLRF